MKEKTTLRQCVSCRAMKDRRELIRVVRLSDGTFRIDPTQKADGRGAYVCKNADCIALAAKRNAFSRSFRQNVPREIYEKLAEFAAGA